MESSQSESGVAGETTGRILIAEDEPDMRELIGTVLQEEGFETILATDGEDAIRKAHEHHPDLIILDIMMPRMDGYETCEAIKADPTTKDIPVVFLSAKAQDSDIEKGKTYDVEEYLTKPFDPDTLIEVVERVLG